MTTDGSSYENIVVTRENGILTCTLNRPHVLNALSPAMFIELQTLFGSLVNDNSVNVVVITGAGRAFCAGGDVKLMANMELTRGFEWPWTSIVDNVQFLQAMQSVPQPIIASVNGDAVGAGSSIALSCDIVLAAETARFADPHVRRGLVPPDGILAASLLTGLNRAKEYLLLGELITATEAERIGLVNHVYPLVDLKSETDRLAEQLATGATAAIRWTKQVLNKLVWDRWNLMVDGASAFEEISARTEDHDEGVNAFIEKRKPAFRGK